MWAFNLFIFFGIFFTFSKGNESLGSSNRGRLKSYTNDNSYISEFIETHQTDYVDYLLSFILQGDFEEQKCNSKLQENQDILRSLFDTNFFHLKKQACSNTGTSLQSDITKLSKELLTELQKTSFTERDYLKLQMKCYFLEPSYPDLIGKCSELRNTYYKKQRNDAADEVLFRVLKEDVNNDSNCHSKLKKYCQELILESPELFLKCLEPEETCKHLKNTLPRKCEQLNYTFHKELAVSSSGNGPVSLENCYFYMKNCDSSIYKLKELCLALQERFSEMGFEYIPPSSDFNPIEEKISLFDLVNGPKVFAQYRETGVFISKFSDISFYSLIVLLINNPSNNDDGNCKKVLERECSYISTLNSQFKYMCDNTETICKNFSQKVQNYFDELKKQLNENNIVDSEYKQGNSDYNAWIKLPLLSEDKCSYLESRCFYFGSLGQNIKSLCLKLSLVCYRSSLYKVSSNYVAKFIQDIFFQYKKFDCKNELIKKCVDFHGLYSENVFEFCFSANASCTKIRDSNKKECAHFADELSFYYADVPKLDTCDKYEPKCSLVAPGCFNIKFRCFTLNDNCYRLRSAIELMYDLLPKRSNYFWDEATCITHLNNSCNLWILEGNSKYLELCRIKDRTCTTMVYYSRRLCKIFSENIEKYKVLDQVQKNPTPKYCNLWASYCEMLSPSCYDFLYLPCESILKHCKQSYIEYALENAMAYELRGDLDTKEKCRSSFNKYCKKTKNTTLLSLCKDGNKANNANDILKREKLCDKFLEHVKEQCNIVPRDLKKAIMTLRSTLFLMTNVTTFEATSIVFNVGLKTKQYCTQIFHKCVFRKECSEIDELCEKIRFLCTNIEEKLSAIRLEDIPEYICTSTKLSTRTITVVNTIDTCESSTDTSEPIRSIASLHFNDFYRWIIFYFFIFITVFMLAFV